MSREKKDKLLQDILEELKGIRSVIDRKHPRDWETCIKEHIRRLEEETLRTESFKKIIRDREIDQIKLKGN